MEQSPSLNKTFIYSILLFLTIAGLFGGILKNPFIYDDNFLILSNLALKTTINPIYYFRDPETSEPETALAHGDQYRPLPGWFLALQYRIAGKDPFIFHAVNLLLHAANAVLFAFILLLLFKNIPLSFAGGLLFGAHPVMTESVAWAYQQVGLLSWFFSFLVILLLLRARSANKRKLTCRFGIFFLTFCAIFSKEQAATLPAIAFFLFFAQSLAGETKEKRKIISHIRSVFRNFWKELVLVTIPVVFYIVIRGIVVGQMSQTDGWGGGRYTMALTMIRAFAHYVKLAFWPHPLSVNYDLFGISRSILSPAVLFSGFLLIGLAVVAFIFMRRLPFLSLGIFWFFVSLAPVSNVIFPLKEILNERFLYFSIAGFIISLAALVEYATKRFAGLSSLRLVLVGVFILLFAFSTYGTVLRLSDWESERALWTHEVMLQPNSSRNQRNFAHSLEADNDSKKAIRHYALAMEASTKEHNTLFFILSAKSLAFAHIRTGEPEKASEFLLEMRKRFPDDLGFFLILGQAKLAEKKFADAEKIFRNVAEGNKGNTAYMYLVIAETAGGKNPAEIKKDVDKIPNAAFRPAAILIAFGKKALLEQKWKEAADFLSAALKEYPAPPTLEPYIWLGQAFEKTGMPEEAATAYTIALEYNSVSIDAHQGLKRLRY
ncbi:MAG: hypothetical protein UX72_C0007G0031 [Parcubacteria group bacterium GW2011_GWA2_47_10]|nr:MAG: hypothetical protein UX72_C0007G0031 [Parcubacteria group bacterium GW2011_GWA2_47_10]